MNKTLQHAVYGILVVSATLAAMLAAPSANAEVGMGLRGGTLGYGVDFDIGMTEKLNLRLAYNYFSYDQTIEDTDVRYDGALKISSFSGYLDWHAFGGGFRFSLGAVTSGPKIEMVGTPTFAGTYNIGGTPYTSAQIGSLKGEIKLGNSVAPYIGIGWGNVVSEAHRVTFLFDLGAIYGGTPDVSLTASCNPSLPAATCSAIQTQLQADLARETRELENDSSQIQWYPVVNIGIGIRF